MNVLLTGASGFVGRAALCKFLADGHRLRACYRSPPQQPLSGVDCWLISDFFLESAWREALSGVDVVVHAAARVHVMQDAAVDPLQEFRRVNVDATLSLARWAANAGVKRFVFISSVKAMGENSLPGAPLSAATPPAPADPYGVSKWEAEQGLMQIAEDTGLQVVIIRPPLVYGPGVKANFASMMRWLSRGVPLPLGCVRSNRRSFVALGNLVDLMSVCITHPAAANQIFLVSDGDDLSTAELLKRMGLALGRRVFLPAVPVFILRWGAYVVGREDIYSRLCGSLQLDIEKTRSTLGWVPPWTVDEGLKRVAEELQP